MRTKANYKVRLKETLRHAKPRNKLNRSYNLFSFLFLVIIGIYIFPKSFFIEVNSLSSRLSDNVFILKEIEVLGNESVTYEEVIAASHLKKLSNINELNLDEVKNNILSNTKIEKASVYRILPSKVRIYINERKPIAIWWENNQYYLVDKNGVIIEKVDENEARKGYIILFGKNAKDKYHEISDLLFHNGLTSYIVSIARVGDRRWDLYLKNDLIVKLPEENLENAIAILVQILQQNNNKILLSAIDLRLIPDKIYIKK